MSDTRQRPGFGEQSVPRDAPVVDPETTPYTAVKRRRMIATAVGGDDRRYTSLPRNILNRLHVVFLGDLPPADATIADVAHAIAVHEDLSDPERLKDVPDFTATNLDELIDALRAYTYADVAAAFEALNCCPVCETPVRQERMLGDAAQVTPEEDTVCVYVTDDEELAVIDHRAVRW